MPNHSQALEKLATLLQTSGAKAVISTSAVPRSTIYDVDYRTAVIGLVFAAFSSPVSITASRRMSAARLKLLQFATIRPAIIRVLEEWSKEDAQSPLALTYSVRMRHAFISDTAHDDMTELLISCGIFERDGGQIQSGSKIDKLDKIVKEIKDKGLFAIEQDALEKLSEIRITNAMLEGW
jgi:hypothetical protein